MDDIIRSLTLLIVLLSIAGAGYLVCYIVYRFLRWTSLFKRKDPLDDGEIEFGITAFMMLWVVVYLLVVTNKG